MKGDQEVLRAVSEEQEDHAVKPAAKAKYSSDESSDEDEEDTRMLEGNVYTRSGVEVIECTDPIDRFIKSITTRITIVTTCLDLEKERRKCQTYKGGDRRGSGKGG